jgi:para-aminobenzoate synthetase component 1
VILDGPHLAPLEAAAQLAGLPGRVLLHSAGDSDGLGRWSFVAAEPIDVISGRGDALVLARLEAECQALAALTGEPPGAAPQPLLIGWLGYDLGRALEPSAQAATPARDDLGLPDLAFGAYLAVWRHDATTGRAQVIGEPSAARALMARLEARGRPAASGSLGAPQIGPLVADIPDRSHLDAVAAALDYIRAGDVYQVNLARRLSAPCSPGDGLALARALSEIAPAPYAALLELGGVQVISNSPELFLRWRAGSARVETRPIKGTRRRGASPAADALLAAELVGDEKERAEHLMIVDLLRNDLGRIAALGSVRVDDFARVVSLPTVHHLVSTVSAEARSEVGVAALLRATFPGGSITGAPKIRAMQIIDELEPVRRGPYTGAIGAFGAGGAVELAIAIRTALVHRGRLTLHVGGGVVADSRPERELEETEEKAAAWRAALARFGA